MGDFQISDNVGNSIDGVPEKVNSVGSLVQYVKTEPLHLLVVPDLIKVAKLPLSQAAQGKALQFQLNVQHDFQLDTGNPKIGLTPESKITLCLNTKAGEDLFSDEPFTVSCKIPEKTAFVSLALDGSVEVDTSVPASQDLTLGFKTQTAVTSEYFRSFASGDGEPTVGAALAETASHFVIPLSTSDLLLLQPNDVAAVSGSGSLCISADFKISLITNPLASINLPIKGETIAVTDGVVADVRASIQLDGSYQVRARKLDQNTVELLFIPEKSTTFELDTSLSAGVTAELSGADLISKLLGAIDAAKTPGGELLAQAGLTDDEADSFSKAVKAGIDRSLAASAKQALSALRSDEPAFAYQIELDQLTADSTAAVDAALRANLSALNRLEVNKQPDGTIAPGVQVHKSILTTIHDTSCAINLNLLGIVNFTSVAEFIKKSEVVTDSVTNDITIKETLTGKRISAIVAPFERDEALRKALFDSVVATLVHTASGRTSLDFSISGVHFAYNQNTNQQNLRNYLNWFSAFGLILSSEHDTELQQLPAKGLSTCLLRAKFESSITSSLFLTPDGSPHTNADYVEIGRRALIALLDPDGSNIDAYRKAALEDVNLLTNVMNAGSPSQIASLLHAPANTDPILSDIYFDGQVIAWWSDNMAQVARSLHTFKTSGSNFDDLTKKASSMINHSPVRFDQPWGLLALSLLAASERSGKIVSGNVSFERSATLPLRAAAGADA